MKAFIQYILLLTFSLGMFFCLGQDEYEGFSKKEMRLLLFKRDSIIKSNQNQISFYVDLTKDLNFKISNKKDSLAIFDLKIRRLNSEKNNLDQDVRRKEKEISDLVNDKNKLSTQISGLNSELKSNKERIQFLEKTLNTYENELGLLSETRDSLSKTLAQIEFTLDSLRGSNNGGFSFTKSDPNDILNNMYFRNVFPKEIHCDMELSGVVITSINGGVNPNDDYHQEGYNIDEYIRSSHNPDDYQWNEDFYAQQYWDAYSNDYRNPKWQVYFATEFIPISGLTISDMNGNPRPLNFKFDLFNGKMVSIKSEYLEENTFLCRWKTDYYFGKKVLEWNLAHEIAGQMRDLFLRTFEVNGESYIALNNFQLLRLKNGFAPVQLNYDEEKEYFTFESQPGNNKILTRLKTENSESAELDPAFCIYLFKLVK